jgi:hypothetical protein
MVSEPVRTTRRERREGDAHDAGLAVDQRRRARDALARRALNDVVVIKWCGVRCGPLAAVRGARSVARVRGGRDRSAVVSATTPVSFYFASPICGFAYMHGVALGLKRCGFAVNAEAMGMRL